VLDCWLIHEGFAVCEIVPKAGRELYLENDFEKSSSLDLQDDGSLSMCKADGEQPHPGGGNVVTFYATNAGAMKDF